MAFILEIIPRWLLESPSTFLYMRQDEHVDKAKAQAKVSRTFLAWESHSAFPTLPSTHVCHMASSKRWNKIWNFLLSICSPKCHWDSGTKKWEEWVLIIDGSHGCLFSGSKIAVWSGWVCANRSWEASIVLQQVDQWSKDLPVKRFKIWVSAFCSYTGVVVIRWFPGDSEYPVLYTAEFVWMPC